MKKFNLLVSLYNGLNRLDELFFRKDHPEYRSKFALHVLIASAIMLLGRAAMVWMVHMGNAYSLSPSGVPQSQFSIVLQIQIVLYVLNFAVFLRRGYSLLTGTGRKIGYVFFSLFFLVIFGPILFPLLLAVLLLVLAVQIALWLLAAVVWVIDLFNSGASGKKRWRLDNGDTVTEKTGLFGEKSYEGKDGSTYTTDDLGETFRKKE